jgi:osmotically-inducible protein OsmY
MLSGLLALAVLPALGCTAQARKEAPPEERESPPAAGREQGSDEAPSASEMKEDAKKAVDEVAEKAEEAAEAAEGLAPKVDAAKQLADVKMALMADPDVDGSAIDVDADEATKTIHLSGTVPTARQKTAAERIAREKARGYKVHNMLSVRTR